MFFKKRENLNNIDEDRHMKSQYYKTTRGKLIVYIAGITDGEGSINISRCLPKRGKEKIPRFELAVVITNSDKRIFPALNRIEKGSLIEKKRYSEKHNKGWNWVLKGKKAINFLKKLRPYLILKKEQADLAIKFWETIKRYKIDKKELKRREKMWLKMKLLNRQ